MYIGGVPVAEHDSLVPVNTCTTGDGITNLGETNEKKIEITKHCKYFLFSIICKYELQYRPNFLLNSGKKAFSFKLLQAQAQVHQKRNIYVFVLVYVSNPFSH